MTAGNGQTALFWEDRWIHGQAISEIAPQLHACISKRRRKTRMSPMACRTMHGQETSKVIVLQEIGQYLQVWHAIQYTNLTAELDRMIWKWTVDENYSAQSCYKATFQGSTSSEAWKLIWRNWAPPRVKFFNWIAVQDRCWTTERLARRGLQHHPLCLLCCQTPATMMHLILACTFAKQVWHGMLAGLLLTCAPPDQE
jgi:hypothetical protein